MTKRTTLCPGSSTRGAGWPVLALVASASFMLFRATHIENLMPVPGRGPGFFDLKIYREAAQTVLAGRPLYAARFQLGFGFTYPPFAVLMFLPLALLPLSVDEIASFAVNVGFVVVIANLTLALPVASGTVSPNPRHRRAIALGAAALALWTEPVMSTLGFGQINLLVTALVLVDLTLGRRARWGGLGVGAAAALKLTPLIFIPYLLFSGRRRMAATALGGFLLATAVSFLASPQNAWAYWGAAIFHLSRVTGQGPHAGRGPANQSLRGALMRVFPGVNHLGDVWFITAAIVACAGLWLAVRASRCGDEAWGYVLTAITGLLICPVSWTHHWVIALPGLLLLAVSAPHGRTRTLLTRAALVAGVGSSAILLEVVRDPSGAHLGLGGLLLGNLFVLVGLGTILAAGGLEWVRVRAGRPARSPRRLWPGRPRLGHLSTRRPPFGYPGHPGARLRVVPTGQRDPRTPQSIL